MPCPPKLVIKVYLITAPHQKFLGAKSNEKRDNTDRAILFLVMFPWPWFHKDPAPGVCAVLCTEGALQPLHRQTKHFVLICTSSLALETDWVRKKGGPCRPSPHTRASVTLGLYWHKHKWMEICSCPRRKVHSMQIKIEFHHRVRPSTSQNSNVYLKEFLN